VNTFARLPFAFCTAALAALAVLPSAALLDNDQVKVSRALEKAHVKGGFHEHKTNRVMIYLQPGRQRFEYKDGRQPAVFDWKTGQIVWSKAEGMHAPEVVSDEPFNIVEVELKKPGTDKMLGAPPKHCKVEIDNNQVRVLRLKLGARESTPAMAHTVNTVEVFLTDTDAHKAGDAVWIPAGTSMEEKAGATPLEAVLIEVKAE